MSNVCTICPHYCNFSNTKYGKCGVRSSFGILNDYYGKCSTLAIDPIEKRPFFHFLPGFKFLSVGLYGCSMRCPMCLNFNVSQDFYDTGSKVLSPQDLVTVAELKNTSGIVFSYNEPTVHYEYLRRVGEICSFNNLYLAIKTNGYINNKIARDLGTLYDAFNIDLKGDEEFYKNHCGGELKVVKRTIETLIEMNVLVEISYLVNPYSVNNLDFHKKNAKWIASLNKNTPVHLLYFYPYASLKESYPQEKLIPIYDIFYEQLNHVYISNVYRQDFMEYRNTKCPKCKKEVIKRENNVKIDMCNCLVDFGNFFPKFVDNECSTNQNSSNYY